MPVIVSTPQGKGFSSGGGGPPLLTDAWDPANSSSTWTLSGMQATVTSGDGSQELSTISYIGVTTGKWYVELDVGAPLGVFSIGLASSTADPNVRPSSAVKTGYYQYSERLGRVYFEATFKEGSLPIYSGILGMAVDMDAGTLRFFNNAGTEFGTLSPYSGLPATELKVFTAMSDNTDRVIANFGQSAFAHSVPAGYNPGWPGYY